MTALWQRQLVAAIVVIAALFSASTAADAEARRVGDLRVVDIADASRSLEQGGSSTPFRLRLPEGATCPGDSANDDWRTQAFLAPDGTDPNKLEYNGVGPVGPGVFPLYGTDTRSYRHVQLEPNDAAGQPGRITSPPAMSFAVFPPGMLPPGRYVAGIACTYHRTTDKYWTVTFDISVDASDQPAQLHWAVRAALASAPAGQSGTTWWAVAVALALVAAIVVVALARRSKPTAQHRLAKETR